VSPATTLRHLCKIRATHIAVIWALAGFEPRG
jgi:hypothetical protein